MLGCPFSAAMGEGNNSPVGALGATRLTGLNPGARLTTLEILVNQHIGSAQAGRQFARTQCGLAEQPVQMAGELAVSFGH